MMMHALGEVEPIVHHTPARDYTPADPCQFHGRCTPDEWLIWARIAGAWINAAGKAARTDADRRRVNTIAVTWTQLEDDGRDCSVFECGEYVRVFIELAERARGLVIEWDGVGVQEVGAWDLNLWDGFTIQTVPWLGVAAIVGLAIYMGSMGGNARS